MANFFDQFDPPPAASTAPNFFDQFDAPAAASNDPGGSGGPMVVTVHGDVPRMGPAATDPDGGPVYAPGQAPVVPDAPTLEGGPAAVLTPGGNATLRGGAQGLSFGLADEVAGGLGGLKSFATGNGYSPGYNAAVDAYRAEDKTAEAAHPWMFGGGKILGNILGLAPAMVAAPEVLGMGAAQGMAARLGYGGLSGFALGGVQGFNEGEGGISDRLPTAGVNAVIGAGGGVAGPTIGAGISALGRGAVDLATARLPDMGRAAYRDMMSRYVASAPGQVEARAGTLGPDAMLMDLSPDFLASAQGLATKDTPAASRVVGALDQRNQGTNVRLASDLDSNFGPYVPAADVEAQFAARRTTAGGMYNQALANGPTSIDTSPVLAEIGQRLNTAAGAERNALLRARGMLLEETPNGVVPRTDPQYLHNVKGALDDLIRYGDDTVGVPRGSLSQADGSTSQIRGILNRQLEENVPGYGDANQLAYTSHRASDALESGRVALRGGDEAIDPSVFAADFRSRPIEQQAALRAGTRAEIGRSVGTNANDLAAIRSVVKADGDWNPQKLAEIFGPDEAARVMNAADREQAFRDAYNQVARNSATAKRTAAGQSYDVREAGGGNAITLPLAAAEIASGHPVAAAVSVGSKAFGKLAQMVGLASDETRNEQVSQALIKQGPALDDLLSAMRTAQARSAANEAGASTADRLVQALISSGAREASPNETLLQVLGARAARLPSAAQR